MDGKEEIKLPFFVVLASLRILFSLQEMKMAKIFNPNAVELPRYSVAIKYGYLQHVLGECLDHAHLMNHVYIVFNDTTQKDCVIIAFNCSIVIVAPGENIERTVTMTRVKMKM